MQGSAAQSSPVQFPPSLDQVGPDDQIPVSLGYLPGGLGVLALLCAAAVVILPEQFPWRFSLAGIAILLALILCAGGLFYWEVRRRERFRVLVPRDGLVGVYAGRQFFETVQLNQITLYRYHHGNTLYRALGGIGLLIACGARAAKGGVFSNQEALAFAAMAAGALFLLLTLYNRIRLLQYFMPSKGGVGDEGIELTRAAASKLFRSGRRSPAAAAVRLTRAVGIMTVSDLSEMIPAGSTLPQTYSETFGNAVDNQDAIRITIAQKDASGIEEVLVADINQLPPRPKGLLNVTVTLTIDVQKQLRLKATVSETAYVKQFGPVPVR